MRTPAKPNYLPIIILGALFFIFGFVTWLNGTLIPYLKIACELNTSQALLVAFAFYISYFVMALPSSWILERTGYKRGMMLGLLVMAAGALIFIPAAQTRTYPLFLTGLFIIGTGLSVLQTASNPYAVVLGPIESAAQRISILGICNKVAGVLAPLILGAVILADADTFVASLEPLDSAARAARLDELAARVIGPYTAMAAALVVLALMVRFSPLPEINAEEEATDTTASAHKKSVFEFPNLVLGVVALFLYVGAEVIAGDTIGTYGQSQGIPLSEAKNFTALTLTAMVIGYILGIIAIPRWITQAQALIGSAVIGVVISILILTTDGYTSVLMVALLGLANALVWPAVWPLAVAGLGRFTKTGAALLIMAIAGGAILPVVYGRLADIPAIGPKLAYAILLPCYLFILYYSQQGRKLADQAGS
ncbi:MAG: sugar MFS transporter [Bacteroidia bacterium]|nr:sugar MFS transporter [Bacteroidia bacterium]